MSSLLFKIFHQAEKTFSHLNRDAFASNLKLLQKLVDSLESLNDLKVNNFIASARAFQAKDKAPCTFVNIYEKKSSTFSMSVFVIENNYTMPLHDHPRMTGLLKVVSGKVKSQSYTRINSDEKEIIVKAEEPKILDEKSGCALLRPDYCNYHELTAIDGPAAFFDILSPPYSDIDDTSEDARHCSFYKKIMIENNSRNAVLRLIQIPVPDHYFCDTVSYEQPDFKR